MWALHGNAFMLDTVWVLSHHIVPGTRIPSAQHTAVESVMAERVEMKVFIHQSALKMQTDDKVAAAWLDATLETLYEHFKAGKGVTLTGFGGFGSVLQVEMVVSSNGITIDKTSVYGRYGVTYLHI